MHVCVGASLLVLYLFKAVLFSQEKPTVWNPWSGNSFVVIFTIFLSPHTSINQVITVGESKILCLYYIFLLPDFALPITQGERKRRCKPESVISILWKNPLSSLCSLGVSKSCLTLQLPSSDPCFHTPWQKCLPSSPLLQCHDVWGKMFTSWEGAQLYSVRCPKWKLWGLELKLNCCICLPLGPEAALCSSV